MGRKRSFLPFLVVCWYLLPHAAFGQQPIHWEATIDSAKQAARQSNKLVLVFFCAGYCAPCHRMENELRNQAGAVTTLETNYVPVKISTEYYPNTAKQYGVTCVPTTVILAPTAQGPVLASFPEYMAVDQYLSKLNKVAADAKRPDSGAAVTQIQANAPLAAPPASLQSVSGPAAPSNPAAQAAAEPATRGVQPTVPVLPVGQTGFAADVAPPAMLPGGGQPINAPLGPQRPDIARVPVNPPIGLEGYCPVQLGENSRWQVGNKAWGAIHRGRTYLFAGLDERNRFLANPDHYAPVSSGDDVVLLLDQARSVAGFREHGLQYEGHVYLFATEETLKKFHSNPRYYADRALQAMRSTAQVNAAAR